MVGWGWRGRKEGLGCMKETGEKIVWPHVVAGGKSSGE